ncbi:MAG: hypothetical protein HY906_07590 [Deltaproteobacteria bacterium]|nr:hypothetical protein [Deltaproteobacteria bacterium]
MLLAVSSDLQRDVEHLTRAWNTGDQADPVVRRAWAERLVDLRRRYRERPDAFSAELVVTLRRLAAALAAESCAPAGQLAARPEPVVFDAAPAAPGTPPVREAILRLVRARPEQSGIVYCLSRRATEATAAFLRDRGIRAGAYLPRGNGSGSARVGSSKRGSPEQAA